jgi:hypothetical protein
MIRRLTNGWVISFLVLAAVSFGLTYGVLALIGDDNGEFVFPDNSQTGAGTEADNLQPAPPTPTDVPAAATQPETPADQKTESPNDLIVDSPDAELAIGDSVETTVTTAEGEDVKTEAPATEAPAPASGAGDSAGVGSVVEFTITRGGGQ